MASPPAAEAARTLNVWWMTTGEAGTRAQARGLAEALSAAAQERLIRVSRLWALLPRRLRTLTPWGVAATGGGALEPPWPDVLVTCGRRSALAAMAMRRANPRPMVTIHIQPPPDPSVFDLVVALPHDRLSGHNVIAIETALHGISREALSEAAGGDRRFARLPRPWTGVLLGGARRGVRFGAAEARRLADGLDALRADIGGSLIVTPSRRTPAEVVEALAVRFGSDPNVWIWDRALPNPYLAILGAADRLVVTADSISMISEALSTNAPVLVFAFDAGRRHAQFVESLRTRGLVTRLGESPQPRARGPVDSRPIVVAAARQAIAAKLGAR